MKKKKDMEKPMTSIFFEEKINLEINTMQT